MPATRTARHAQRAALVVTLAVLAGCGRVVVPAVDPSTVATPAPPTSATTAPAVDRPELDASCRFSVIGIGDHVEGAVGTTDPLGEARRWAGTRYPGVDPVVAFEGEDELDVVFSTQDRGVVAVLVFWSDGRGGWLLKKQRACTSPPPSN